MTKIIETTDGWVGYTCDDCGKLKPGPDHPAEGADFPHFDPDGNYLCDECAKNVMVECEDCGDTMPLSEAEECLGDSLVKRYCHVECPTQCEEV